MTWSKNWSRNCNVNMLRNASDLRCTCKEKKTDCDIFVPHVCSICGGKCELRCNICKTCFPGHAHQELEESHCYDCSMDFNEDDYYEGW